MVTRKFAYSKVVSFIICMGFGLGAWGDLGLNGI